MGHAHLGEARQDSNTFTSIPKRLPSTWSLTLTGPRFPISGHFGPAQRGLFGRCLCREWSRAQVGSDWPTVTTTLPHCLCQLCRHLAMVPCPLPAHWQQLVKLGTQQELFLATAQVPAACWRSRCLCCVSRACWDRVWSWWRWSCGAGN